MSEIKTKPAPSSKAPQLVEPNLFNLAGGGLYVSYSSSGFDGKPQLSYQDSLRTLSFSGDQIHAVNVPDLGTVVSVTIVHTVDSGSTSFSLLLPRVNLPGPFNTVPISTDGVTTHHAFSIIPAFNHGQRDFYTVTELQGTATQVVF